MKTTRRFYTDIRGLFSVSQRSCDGNEAMQVLDPATIAGSVAFGWQDPANSDLVLQPDASRTFRESFLPESASAICDVKNTDGSDYALCPRTLLKRVCAFFKQACEVDEISIGVELEFHVFDAIRYKTSGRKNLLEIVSAELDAAQPSNGHVFDHCSMQSAPFPVDSEYGLRRKLLAAIEAANIRTHADSHESGQCQHEISLRAVDPLHAADAVQISKHLIRNVVHAEGKTATFLPRPLGYDFGSGQHLNFSVWRKGENLFWDRPGETTDFGKSFVAGIFRHVKALNALTNPTSNSYSRLFHQFDPAVPLTLGYKNRKAHVRLPHFRSSEDCRLEVRFPDSTMNPYLGYAAILLAGLDGILEAAELPVHEKGGVPFSRPYDVRNMQDSRLAFSLQEALHSLHKDWRFLARGGHFPSPLIDTLVKLGSQQVAIAYSAPNPVDFHTNYSL